MQSSGLHVGIISWTQCLIPIFSGLGKHPFFLLENVICQHDYPKYIGLLEAQFFTIEDGCVSIYLHCLVVNFQYLLQDLKICQ